MKSEVQGCRTVNPKLIQSQDVLLQVGEHGHCEAVLEESCDVLQGENHLLVHLDGDLEGHRVDDSQEGWLDVLVGPQVVVSQVSCLQHSLVKAFSLHSELQNREESLFAELRVDALLVNVLQIVDGVVLKVGLLRRAHHSLLHEHMLDVCLQLVLAILLNGLVHVEVAACFA